ncbi:MAG: 4Fe-4S dicluster domain-containing protein [Coriobacteriia bacterium]|nr:4Fe-4S dicluster domain-containing protein [Coriobacteriia bacterium]
MKKYGMLLDLNRCVGCGACQVSCKLFNNQKDDISWIHIERLEWEPGDANKIINRGYLPHACMQCEEPPCVPVCPTGATYRREEDGITIVEYEKCISCGACVIACPYGARAISNQDEFYFDSTEPAPYEEYGIIHSHVAEKCEFCYQRLEDQLEPACVINCPIHARYFGDMDDPESPISKRMAERKDKVVRIDETRFYYESPEGMPQEFLPTAGVYSRNPGLNQSSDTSQEAPKPQSATAKQDETKTGVDPAVAVGAAAVGAAGIGAAVYASVKSKAKKSSDEEKEDQNDK